MLARFDDGSVALAERRVGEGTVVAFSSTFDGYWNDLPVQPVFLPLIQSLVRHAANWNPQPPWETVGGVSSVPASSARGEMVAVSPSGARTRWSETDSVRSLALREQGFYELRGSGSTGETRTIAVNANTTESELGRFPPDELARAVTPPGTAVAGSAPATTLSIAEREKRQTMWWYVLVIALLLLAAESLLSNRLSRTARRDVSPANGRLENA